MSHLAIDTEIGFITTECSDRDARCVSDFFREKFCFKDGFMVIGKRTKSCIEVYNDRGLSPIMIKGVRGLDKLSDRLSLIYGSVKLCGGAVRFVIDRCIELNNEIHFGEIKSDLGFKTLTNSIVLDYDTCFSKITLDTVGVKSGERIIGRLSDFRCNFDIQVLKIV